MNAAIFPNLGKPGVYGFLADLEKTFQAEGISFYLPECLKTAIEENGLSFAEDRYRSKKWIGENVQFLFSVGGDGSFLQAAREMAGHPMLLAGIHLGDLGFLNSITPENLAERLEEIKRGEYTVEKRVFLSSYIIRGDGTREELPDVLNDIVVGHDRIGKMARLRLYINGKFFQQYPADGLIVSTPTGSTSYTLSCGGPIMDSRAEQMLVVPICPHMIQNFSMILPYDAHIMIQLPEREEALHISLDGNGACTIRKNEELHIECRHREIGFLRFPDQDFFTTISSRLFPRISR